MEEKSLSQGIRYYDFKTFLRSIMLFFLSFNFNTSCLSEANNLCAMYECTFDISVHAHPAW